MPESETQEPVDIEPILDTLSKGAEASAELSVKIAALLINKVLPTLHDLGKEIKQLPIFERDIRDSLADIQKDVRQLSYDFSRNQIRQAEQNSKRLRAVVWDVLKLALAALIGALGAKWSGKP